MKYIIKENNFKITDVKLLSDLRRTAKLLGRKSLKNNEYRLAGNYGVSTVSNRFGSWNKALEKAGLEIEYNRVYSEKDLLINLKNVWDCIGRQPNRKEMVKPLSKYYNKVYNKTFGSWNNTLKRFLKFVGNKNAKLEKKTVNLRLLQKRLRRGVYKPVTKTMRFEVFKRDKFKCRFCGSSPSVNPGVILHVDHIIPVSKGGKTVPANLQTLCSDCNLGKADKNL